MGCPWCQGSRMRQYLAIDLGTRPEWARPGRLGDMAIARLPKPSGLSRLMLVIACLIGSLVASIDSLAYTAAGDRIFAPTGILPQIAPTNQIYGWAWTLPQSGEAPGTRRRVTNTGAFFDKTVFGERLSLYTQGSWFRIDRAAADPR